MCINSFHWILLSIVIDRARVVVFDGKRMLITQYQDFIDILQKACARFIIKHIGVIDMPCDLYIKADFPLQYNSHT
jgi:hypothetical protein